MCAGIMSLYEYVIQPFAEYGFMSRALVACVALAVGGAPLGVFLVMRRMTLVGDAMSHAILPGASLAFLLFGVSLWPMTLGALAAGVLVAAAAGAAARFTHLKEDASFTGMYLLSLAAGIMIISLKGSAVDLMHILFGNVLAVDSQSLILVTGIATLSALTMAAVYRGLVLECFDPGYLRAIRARGEWMHQLFLLLLVLNLVAAFQALGTLMALGLIVLPAISSRFWMRGMDGAIIFSVCCAIFSAMSGLLLSYHYSLPSGPAIVMMAGGIYVVSVLFGLQGSIAARCLPHKHLAA